MDTIAPITLATTKDANVPVPIAVKTAVVTALPMAEVAATAAAAPAINDRSKYSVLVLKIPLSAPYIVI